MALYRIEEACMATMGDDDGELRMLEAICACAPNSNCPAWVATARRLSSEWNEIMQAYYAASSASSAGRRKKRSVSFRSIAARRMK